MSECVICYTDSVQGFRCPDCLCFACRTCMKKHIFDNADINIYCVNCDYQLSIYDIHNVLQSQIKQFFKILNEIGIKIEESLDYRFAEVIKIYKLLPEYYDATKSYKRTHLIDVARSNDIEVLLEDENIDIVRKIFDKYFRNIDVNKSTLRSKIFSEYRNTSKSKIILSLYNTFVRMIVQDIEYKVKYKCQDCPNGFLDNNYICVLCNTKFCHKCFEKLTSSHQCDENDIASIKLIKKDTRPCPKCYTRIHKISGCNQMFCTNCNIGFDWKTGALVKQNFHNPHRAEWLRNNADIIEHTEDDCLTLAFPYDSVYYDYNQQRIEINDLITTRYDDIYNVKKDILRLLFLIDSGAKSTYKTKFVSISNTYRYIQTVNVILQQYSEILRDILFTAIKFSNKNYESLLKEARDSTQKILDNVATNMFNRNAVSVTITRRLTHGRVQFISQYPSI